MKLPATSKLPPTLRLPLLSAVSLTVPMLRVLKVAVVAVTELKVGSWEVPWVPDGVPLEL